ncbi:hypothetical protein [Streptosporangium sandarakinum]|uniref:hypothetical protein n=1 Tax=Streptosporangium sandarakinum TaxID=1260955 RepID=UPI00368DBFBE
MVESSQNSSMSCSLAVWIPPKPRSSGFVKSVCEVVGEEVQGGEDEDVPNLGGIVPVCGELVDGTSRDVQHLADRRLVEVSALGTDERGELPGDGPVAIHGRTGGGNGVHGLNQVVAH